MDPSFFLFTSAISAMNTMSYSRDQQRLYDRQAQQLEFDASMQELRGLQESNALTEKFNSYISATNAQRAKLGRSTNDRSINAMLDKARRSNREEQARSLLQSQASVQQSLGRADISRMEGRLAITQGYMSAFNTMSTGYYRFKELS